MGIRIGIPAFILMLALMTVIILDAVLNKLIILYRWRLLSSYI